jgi:cholesterol transport system auxiliary component
MIGLGAVLAGCSILPKVNEPVPLYNLVAPIRFDGANQKVARQLTIGLPVASADLDSSRIALSRSPGVVEYFGNGQWADNAPILVRDRLIEAFEINGAIEAVGRDASGLSPDAALQVELRDFQVEFLAPGGAPTGHVRLAVNLIALPQRRIIHSQTVDKSVKAQDGALPSVVRALDEATSQAVADVVVAVIGALG